MAAPFIASGSASALGGCAIVLLGRAAAEFGRDVTVTGPRTGQSPPEGVHLDLSSSASTVLSHFGMLHLDMTKPQTTRDIHHRGKLHPASLFHCLPPKMIVRSRDSRIDPLALGSNVSKPLIPIRFTFSGLHYAAAEAVVTLACLVERIRAASGSRVMIDAGPGSNHWAQALRLDRLTSDSLPEPSDSWNNPFGCHAYPLQRAVLENAAASGLHAAELMRLIRLLPLDILGDDPESMISSIGRVADETILNVWEHAYGRARRGPVFYCATITPTRYFDSAPDLLRPFSSPQEMQWLSDNAQGHVLEIAIGDAGLGTPRTLWASAKERRRDFTKTWSTTPLRLAERARAHQHLCQYAFHHDSTCKGDADFSSPAAKLSWRGLHRCIKQTEYLSGSIVLASGRGRAGYAFLDRALHPIAPDPGSSADLPGTVVVLRFPIRQRALRVAVGRHGLPSQSVHVAMVLAANELDGSLTAETMTQRALGAGGTAVEKGTAGGTPRPDGTTQRPSPTAVVASLDFDRHARTSDLIDILRHLIPNYLTLLVFGDVPEAVRTELRAYVAGGESPVLSGTPRLLGLWDMESNSVSWKIAGEIPDATSEADLCAPLERQGFADLRAAGPQTLRLARDIADAYPDCVSFDSENRHISFYSNVVNLSVPDYRSALNLAFESWMRRNAELSFVFSCSEGEAIRIPTGRLVRRFLSVLLMFQQFPVLAASVSGRFWHVLAALGKTDTLCIVTDCAASYFVATTLLRSRSDSPSIQIFSAEVTHYPGSQVVLFVDGIYRGETLRRLVRKLEVLGNWSGCVISAVDMRRAPLPKLLDLDCRVESLLEYCFDAEEWSGAQPERIYEVDTTTHTVLKRTSEFRELGRTQPLDDFLCRHPEFFRAGLHRLADGRLQTISVDTARLVGEESGFLIDAAANDLSQLLVELLGDRVRRDCVLFCRPESHIYRIVARLGAELQRRVPSLNGIYLSSLRVAPAIPRPRFPQGSLLAECRLLAGQASFEEKDEPRSGFVAIYLDDAAITGRSLQDFIVKATTLEAPRPSAIVSFVLINRLSPREVRFHDVCRHLQPALEHGPVSNDRTRPIPYRFVSLFRLQVGVLSEGWRSGVFEVVRALREREAYFDERLRAYTAAVQQRLDTVVRTTGPRSTAPAIVRHPHYVRDGGSVGFDTRVVRLRHLLALNAQNEGVMSEVLDGVISLAAEGSGDLAAMFALEPELLEEKLLESACWPPVIQLCRRLIVSGEDDARKSDALAILHRRPEELLAQIGPILVSIRRETALLAQLGASLLSFARPGSGWLTRIRTSLERITDRTLVDAVAWLRLILDVPERVEVLYVIRDRSDAYSRVQYLVSATWPHVRGFHEWQRFAPGMLDTERLTGEEVELGTRCIEFAERVLLPGLAAMRFLSAGELPPEETARLWEVFLEGNRRVVELRQLLKDRSAADHQERSRCSEIWTALRHLTLKAASPYIFLGTAAEVPVGSEPSALEVQLPRLFCCPFLLLQQLVPSLAPMMTVDYEEGLFADGCVIVPVARSIMLDFLRILLDNLARYAHSDGCTSTWRVSDQPTAKLTVTFKNRPRVDLVPGTGTGIRLLEALARKGSFRFEKQVTADEYCSIVSFPDVLVAYPDLGRS